MNKKLLVVAISSALTAPLVGQVAQADAPDLSVSGHVNRMVRWADDGEASDVQQVDNDASQSRLRARGSWDIGNGLETGVNLEMGWNSSRSGATPLKSTGESPSAVGTTGGEVANEDTFGLRHTSLFFSGNFGKVTLGQTSVATDGMAFADLSGTALVDEASSEEVGSAIVFRDSAGGNVQVGGADLTLGDARESIDGGRTDVLRYDTPALGPATIAGSVGNNESWHVGAFMDQSFTGGQLQVNGGYERIQSVDSWAISGSFLFNQGTNITGMYSQRDFDTGGRSDAKNYYVKLGHKWGNNAASISWGETKDGAADNVDSTMYGLGFVHTIPGAGVELYTGYHHFEADVPATSVEDIDIAVVGARVSFN